MFRPYKELPSCPLLYLHGSVEVAVGPDAQRPSIHVWHVLSSPGTITLNGGLDQHDDRLADRLRKGGPCGHDGGQGKRRPKANPKRAPKEFYTKDSYRYAIRRACLRVGVPPWHPHQLRHTAATRFRKDYSLEVAQVLLGHRRADVTQVYAERDQAKAREIMAKSG